jgi:hypothetical protein
METRLQEMGGQLTLKSAPGAGTKIEVSVTLDKKESWIKESQLG